MKAALGFAERLFIDHQHIDQELFDDLHQEFTTEQIVELGWTIVSCMAYGRLIWSFGLSTDDLPVVHPVY